VRRALTCFLFSLLAVACASPIERAAFRVDHVQPGRALYFGSAVVQLAGAPQAEGFWHGVVTDDLEEEGARFEVSFGQPSIGFNREHRRVVLHPGVVTPFIAVVAPGRHQVIAIWIKTHIFSDSENMHAFLEGVEFDAPADRATYVGRVVFTVPREVHVRGGSGFRMGVLDAEAEDRTALGSELEGARLPIAKGLIRMVEEE
jgi:hypothetical protein